MAEETPSILKLRFDLLLEEQKVLNSTENWATTLFLTAIALVVKQIVDWSGGSGTAPANGSIPIQGPVYLVPFLIGIVAFCFLRALNFRIRSVRNQQYRLISDSNKTHPSPRGVLGWLMAGMPLVTGFSCSLYLILVQQGGLVGFGISCVAAAFAVHRAKYYFDQQVLAMAAQDAARIAAHVAGELHVQKSIES
ncbi:hypothetical protein FN976_19665 [Caenimonas sedimenti]|uniref:Uncharacterized protein n=1 Tax=Caenimonas sedimenti TaxID=2596921 RepID=A0A562ZMF9_9BURK|nr:hypothetical protein [Caenimonas sedimenti]TWO69505.1 hypothetical protein FN976_19665 [Caenimonas sedimenti]